MDERIERLLESASRLDDEAPESRRREELMARAMAAGRTREDADLIFDIAGEEGVDPGVAFEIVLCGVGVRDIAPVTVDSWQETQVEAPPAWVGEPEPAFEANLERRLRTSFRRLRRLSEAARTNEAAVHSFVREPDVGAVDY